MFERVMVIAESLRYFPIFTGGDVIEGRLINLGSAEAISRDGGKAELTVNPSGLPTTFSLWAWYHR